ncbi:flagellar protein FlgN [Paenibacillus sinopodophylli]|uniref:flagellar protein FlgN n=1 Tax=Paenibacillus sinopodophylli TaxID=1837342 RepID=UPI00110D0AF7|nr:flagellar protein FlgN [Paenibacillus sinopodophylli]
MSVSQIVDTLQQQYRLYEQLLDIELKKKALIMKNDVLTLNVLTQKEKLLAANAEKLEQQRVLLTVRYIKEIGFRIRSGVLSELIKAVTNPNEKEELIHMHGKLTSLLTQLKHANDLNQQLIQQSLDYLDFSIGLMVDDPNEDLVYRHPMNQQAGNRSNKIFDSRA